MGSFLDGPGGAQILAVMNEISPALERFKAQYGVLPPGTVSTLDNGVVGTWLADGTLRIDFTPQAVRDAAGYRVAASGGGGSSVPSNVQPFQPPPAIQPRSPGLPPPLAYGTTQAPPAKIFGLPPYAVAAGAGLLVYLIARRL